MRADSHTQSRVPFTCAYVCVSSAQYDARTRALPLCNTNLSVLLGRILLPHCMWHTKAAATTKDALTHTQTHTHIHRHIVRTRALCSRLVFCGCNARRSPRCAHVDARVMVRVINPRGHAKCLSERGARYDSIELLLNGQDKQRCGSRANGASE